jgi:NodT family efflux transporter outer membrane factor (OMF) lipoprotein
MTLGKSMRIPSTFAITRAAPVVVLLGLFAFSCTVGPNYRRPQIELPANWLGAATKPEGVPATQASQTVQAAADVARWWTVLDDPVLDSLVERAIESNLDLKRAAARIRQARASRGVAEAGLFPTADLAGRYSHSVSGPGDAARNERIVTLPDGTPVPAGGGNRAESRSDLFRAGLDAAWELDVFGGIRRDVEAAGADEQFAIEDWRDVLVTLASEVALNYADVRQFQRQIDIAVKNLDAQVHTADVTRRKFAGGEVSRLDVANADAQVATTRAQIPSLRTLERQAIYNLSVLLGQEPGALVEELSHGGPIPGVPRQIPVGLPSDLLRRRPDIRRAEAAAHAATARVGVAVADLFPKFSLTGSLGLQGDHVNSLGDARNYFWSFGPSVSWPLFDAGRIRSNINLRTAAQEEALLTYRATILTALQDVESALVAFTNEQERRQSLTESVQQNRRAVALSLQLYSQGNEEFLNVLNAERSLLGAEDALAQSDRTVVTNLIALYKALGGGWETPAAAPASPEVSASTASAPTTQPRSGDRM